MIIFLTDGAVGYEKDVFQSIDENNINDARIFPICIGYAPNSFLLEKVAEMTRGSYTYIKNHGEITKKLTTLFNKIENPVSTKNTKMSREEFSLWLRKVNKLGK